MVARSSGCCAAPGNVLSVAWDPNGRTLATASDDHSVRIWDVQGSKELLTLRVTADQYGAWLGAPDGGRLATGVLTRPQGWDSRGGEEFLALRPDRGPVKGVVWSPDAKKLATEFEDEELKCGDARSGKELCPLKSDPRVPLRHT